MKMLLYWTWTVTAASVAAIHLVDRAETAPTAVSLDIGRHSLAISPAKRDRLRRIRKRSNLQLSLDNLQTLYFANITLGTPAQSLRLAIDTGSSDIWANSAASQLCTQSARSCSSSGTYAANKSSTYTYANSAFSIKYADGSYAQGDYATDTLSMGGTTVTGVTFGIGYSSTSSQGILGIGYPANEASVSTTGRTYQNLPQVLVSKKLINSAAYSLWLNDLDANTGSVLFGGVDTAKYKGSLQTVPIIKEQGSYREFVIALTGLAVSSQTVISSSNAISVLLDSGSSLSYLPTTYAQALFTIFNAQYSSSNGAATVNCNLKNNAATVDFTFSGIKISVPLNELVIVDSIRNGRQTCIFGISDAGTGGTSVLGDTFLRSAYVVYDLSNNQISLATTNFNATGSNVRDIASGASGVPDASLVSNAVTTVSATAGGARGPSVTGISSGAAQSPLVSESLWLGILLAIGSTGVAALVL